MAGSLVEINEHNEITPILAEVDMNAEKDEDFTMIEKAVPADENPTNNDTAPLVAVAEKVADALPVPENHPRIDGAFLAKCATGGLVASMALLAATPLILGVAGFSATGVVAGSVAASVQSAVYGGATTGLFSLCQSIAAAGFSTATIMAVPAATASSAVAIGAATKATRND